MRLVQYIVPAIICPLLLVLLQLKLADDDRFLIE